MDKTLSVRLLVEREWGCRGRVEDRAPNSLGVWHGLVIGMGGGLSEGRCETHQLLMKNDREGGETMGRVL